MIRFLLFIFFIAGIITLVFYLFKLIGKHKLRKVSIEYNYKDSVKDIKLDKLENKYNQRLDKLKNKK